MATAATPQLNPPRFAAALDAAHLLFGIHPRIVLSNRRDAYTTSVRRAVWLALRDACGAPLVHLGSYFERDHSTIIIGLRKARRDAARDPEYAAAIELIASEVRAA